MPGKPSNNNNKKGDRRSWSGSFRPVKKLFKSRRNILITLFAFLALPLILFVILVLLVRGGAFGPVPDYEQLRNISHYEASAVFSADEKLLGTYFVQNRANSEFEEISPVFIDALLAIEDIRFHQHNGLDSRAIGRVLFKSILLGKDTGGGSTISQQLAKNLFPRRNAGRFSIGVDKIREVIIAMRLENIYTKEQVLELYLNTVSMGEETYGLEMAARRFFDTTPDQLNMQESASLAGVLRSPHLYNPRLFPERAMQRRNVVIRQMEKYGMISPDVADSVISLPMELRYNRITHSDGPAPYFREHLRIELQRLLAAGPALDGRTYNLYTDGLRIEITIDSRVQKAAEEAAATQMAQLQKSFNRQLESRPVFGNNDPEIIRRWKQTTHYRSLLNEGKSELEIEEILHTPIPMHVFTWEGDEQRDLSPHDSIAHYMNFLDTGFLAMNPGSGEILAWVGGINHNYFQYDHVKSRRQAGSAFKPFVYATALEAGVRPCDYQRNRLTTYAAFEDWTPRNIRDEYGGYFSIQAALAQSVNTISVELLMHTGIPAIRETAARMGITSQIPNEPSIALGTAELSLLELTSAYATFANRGIPTSPYYLKAIYNSDDEKIYDFSNPNTTEGSNREPALSPESAAAIVGMLAKAVNEGTGYALRSRFGIQHALAGKTGTTQNNSDGWFIGMTPDLVFGAWVGGWSPRMRLREAAGFGSQTALPVAGYFLNNLAKQEGLPAQPNAFHSFQQTLYETGCDNQQDDRFADRVHSFFTGRDSDEARVVKPKEERRGIGSRIRRLFGGD